MSDRRPTMQFTQHVLALWPWLPAFRAVAETEHLPTAARELDVVPSSLSRAIRLLEETLGVALFDHSGKLLVLNDAGRALLEATRHAMRLLDDAARAVRGSEMTGTLVAAASNELWSTLLAPACVALHRQHPGLEVSIRVIPDDEIGARLLSGELDAAVVTHMPRDPDLTFAPLDTRPRSAYVAAGSTVSTPPRCVIIGTRAEPTDDGWPSTVPRQIAVWAHDPCVAFQLCLQGELVLAAADEEAKLFGDGLTRLLTPEIRDQQLFVVHRRVIGVHPRTEALVTAITAALRRPL